MDLKRRILCAAAALSMLLVLSGCRVRTGVDKPGSESILGGGTAAETAAGEAAPESAGAAPAENGAENTGEADENGSRTRENPDSSRKEYRENAPAEIVPGAERKVHAEGEGAGTPVKSEDSGQTAERIDAAAEEPARRTAAAEEAERKGISEDAVAADSARVYYETLLRERTESMFECERANVYWETADDHVTVHRSSPEHELILRAGAYDVSARLLPENLRVDDGWIARKNPQVIVKITDGSVLGSGAHGTAAAEQIRREILGRVALRDTDAVRDDRVVLISEETLETPYLRTAAALRIAKTAAPELFADTDPAEALRAMAEEAAGIIPDGIYFYTGWEE